MNYRHALVALLLPLSGCIVPPPGPYGAYPQPVYPGAYPAPAPYAQPDYAYPGYAYNDGSPTLFVDGVTWPLVFYGGGWGYWDGYRHWHAAPPGVWNHLNQRHPGGVGYRPFGGTPPGGFRPGPAAAPRGPAAVPRGAAPSRPAPSQAPARRLQNF